MEADDRALRAVGAFRLAGIQVSLSLHDTPRSTLSNVVYAIAPTGSQVG
jgi:hypothetical protein